ncbi:oligosaccharide flippase family protein [Paraburkholderia sp. BCC1885]|jgi:O-antigen/teichoic acid export membrane protein|uniref:oligosaccharide flippase family protein n=1 Tax=Paraburkholderia sp. BCC1885 TaxID=2562669 RepID=UPI00118407A8|nr:oligosaccharide flippase family protein [Paraburkholderia sp. BCC1885]
MNKIRMPLSKIELLAVYLSYAFRYLYPLILVPYYGRVLGTGGYGVVLAGMSLGNTIWMFVGYGFSTVGSRDIVHTENDSERDPIFREQFTARLLLCIPGLIIGALAAAKSQLLSHVPGAGILVVAGGMLAAFNLGWYFTATGRAQTSVLIEVLGFLLSSALIFTIIRKPQDIDLVFPLTFLSSLVQSLLAYWVVRKEFSGVISHLRKAVDVIKRSTTIFIYGGTSMLLIGASAYMLSLLAAPSEVSAFGVPERLIGAALSLMGPAGQILVPKVMYLVGRNNARANLIARRIFVVFFLGAVVGVIVTRSLSGWIVPLVFGPEFSRAVPVLNFMVLVLPVSVCTQILGVYFLIPRKLERVLVRCGIIGALVNVAAAIPLAKYFGAMGMAEARVLGEVSLLAMLMIGVWRAGLVREILGIGEEFSLHTRFGRWLE